MAEMVKMLGGGSFAVNDGDQYYSIPRADQAHKCITEQLVERALFSQLVNTARGPDMPLFRSHTPALGLE